MLSIHCKSCIKSWRNKKDPQRITKIKPLQKYNWEGINYPWEKKIEKNNLMITLNIWYAKKEKLYPAKISKQNSKCEKPFILLIIWNEEGWYYIAVKKSSALLRQVTSKHDGDFSVWIVFILSEQKTNLNYIKKYMEIKIFKNIRV